MREMAEGLKFAFGKKIDFICASLALTSVYFPACSMGADIIGMVVDNKLIELLHKKEEVNKDEFFRRTS